MAEKSKTKKKINIKTYFNIFSLDLSFFIYCVFYKKIDKSILKLKKALYIFKTLYN